MVEQENTSDAEFDALMKDLAADAPAPSDDLMARILQDAEDLRPVPGALVEAQKAQSPWGALLGLIGGWAGAGGLVTAGIVGLWVGVSPPSLLEAPAASLWDVVSPDLTGDWSNFDDLL